jgi:hypothetical protein
MKKQAQTGTPGRPRGVRRILLGGSVPAALLLGAALTGLATAQEAGDGPLIYVDVGTGLRHESRTPGTDAFSVDTRIGAGVFAATSSRRFSLEGEVLLQTQDGEDFITDPAATLSYAIFNRGAEISTELSYSARDLDDVTIGDEFDATDLTRDGGRRERVEAVFGLVTGRDAPFGTETELLYRGDAFSDGATADDETLTSVDTTLRFTINPQITLRATGFLGRTETEDAGNTVETVHAYGLGADLLIDPAWSASIDLGRRERVTETDVLGVRVRSVVEGIDGALSLTREMPNGVLGFSAERRVVATGSQDTFRLRREMVLANGAEVSGSLGAVIFEGADPIAIFGAAYANELRPGTRVSFSLDRTGGVSADDANIIRTRLRAGLEQDLTPVSSLSLDLALAEVDDQSLGGIDTRRVDLALAYRHALTADWNLAARASRGVVFEAGAETDRITVLTLGIERRFSFRP